MMKLTLPGPGCTVTIEGNDNKNLIEQAEFWAKLPTHCPVCGHSLRLTHKKGGDDNFYGLACSSPVQEHRTTFGERKADEVMYYKGDGKYQNPKEPNKPAVWSWGYWDGRQEVGCPPGSGMPKSKPAERVGESPTDPDLDPDVQYDELGWPTDELIGDDQFLRVVVEKAREGKVHYHQVVRYAKEKFDKDMPMDTHYLIGGAATEAYLGWLGSVVVKLGSSG